MVTDQQVRRLFAMQNKYEYQYQAADAAGITSWSTDSSGLFSHF